MGHAHRETRALEVGIVTLSDRGHAGERADSSGPALESVCLSRGWSIRRRALLPDEPDQLSRLLIDWSDARLDLILTTGGTGLGPRDRTPEASRRVAELEVPGLGELMRSKGRLAVPTAALSRSGAWARRRCLIVNLPGSPRGAVESLEAVADLLPHASAMLRGGDHEEEVHDAGNR